MPDEPNPLSSAGPDRAAHRRRDARWLEARLNDPATRVVPVWQARSLIVAEPAPRAVLLPASRAREIARPDGPVVLLGEEEGVAYFAVEVASEEAARELEGEGEFLEMRRYAALLDPREGALLAHARGMLYWHQRHRFCGECGQPTVSDEGGHLRVCADPGCAARQFPRTDPAIIVRVTAAGRCLLGRQPQWPAGQYSVIAGFVEPGESLEDAVRREVLEETGLAATDVRYHSSQPWPFPASLMLGFTATAEGSLALRPDPEELEDARWVSRDELRRAIEDGEMRLPSPISIAHRLIREWLDEAGNG